MNSEAGSSPPDRPAPSRWSEIRVRRFARSHGSNIRNVGSYGNGGNGIRAMGVAPFADTSGPTRNRGST
jgi:hypothetical protein